MESGNTPRKSRDDWEREVEELCARMGEALRALGAALSSEASCRRLAAQFLTAPGYFDEPTPEVIARFRRESREREEMAGLMAKEGASQRREIEALSTQARRLGGEIEAAQDQGERGIETLRRRSFGRYTDELRNATTAWHAERNFFGDLLRKLGECIRSARERLATLEKERAQADAIAGMALPAQHSGSASGAGPGPGRSLAPPAETRDSSGHGRAPSETGSVPSLPWFRL